MTAERTEPMRPRRFLIRRAMAWMITTFRWFIIVGWLVVAGAVYLLLPPLSAAANAGELTPFLPEHSQRSEPSIRPFESSACPC